MCDFGPTFGVRFQYGDLMDVVNLLAKDPTTRQAYLPVWFPEDTGAVDGQRVPCTLGYHFRLRDGKLNCTYNMRSCDYLRHLRDDIYMAMRLMYWVADMFWTETHHETPGFQLGTLVMTIGSLHIFDGDRPQMPALIEKLESQLSVSMLEAMRS
jgi:thymidylate synthase